MIVGIALKVRNVVGSPKANNDNLRHMKNAAIKKNEIREKLNQGSGNFRSLAKKILVYMIFSLIPVFVVFAISAHDPMMQKLWASMGIVIGGIMIKSQWF
jgi:hypothetical protein